MHNELAVASAGSHATEHPGRTTVAIITRDRRESLLQTLRKLHQIPGPPPIIVVDNGSTDDTPSAVAKHFPDVIVVPLGDNAGSAGRTVAAELATTPFLAFSDDDSWWAPDAFGRAESTFDQFPRLAVLAGLVIVEPAGLRDPVCDEMAASPVRIARPLPGPAILGFVACGAIVRRDAYLAAGGFHRRFGVGGEEELLALDLATRGWDLAYVDDIVAHHEPSPSRNPARRREVQARNRLWVAWLRRPALRALAITAGHARQAVSDRAERHALFEALRGLPWVVRERRRLPAGVERNIRRLERR